MYTERIDRALQASAMLHEGQYRKNPERRIPYMAHPVAVALMLIEHGFPEDVVIAGMLHDTVEDTSCTLEDIESEFGPCVARLVAEVSEPDKSLPWAARKAAYIEHLRFASPEARAISCADKTHNLISMVMSAQDGGDIFSAMKSGRDKQVERFERMLPIFMDGSLPAAMAANYEAALRRVKAL